MGTARRRIGQRIAAALTLWLTIAFWLFAIPTAHASPGGTVQLNDGAVLTWSVQEGPPQPMLALAAPASIEWSPEPPSDPIRIGLHSNYAAFVDRWELTLFRESDTRRKHPVGRWTGTGASLNTGVNWNGAVLAGPSLRPGETLIARFRVRDVAGNVDEAEPQKILITRYLMKKERRRLESIAATREASLRFATAQHQKIPVFGQTLFVDISATSADRKRFLSGVAMQREPDGRWTLSQIVPAGSYPLKVQTDRPIIGGMRLVSVGSVTVNVHTEADRFVMVKGAGTLDRSPHDIASKDLRPDGVISGFDALRLSLWNRRSAKGEAALAQADARKPMLLYKDARGRNILRVPVPYRSVPWRSEARSARPGRSVSTKVEFTVEAPAMLTLPHTDIERGTARVFVENGKNTRFLRSGQHFAVDPQQGRVRLTAKGREEVDQLRKPGSVLGVRYKLRPSFAGLVRSIQSQIRLEGNGSAQATTYGGVTVHIGETETKQPDSLAMESAGQSKGWLSRNFGWLVGG